MLQVMPLISRHDGGTDAKAVHPLYTCIQFCLAIQAPTLSYIILCPHTLVSLRCVDYSTIFL